METNAKKIGAMKLKQIIDGCNTLIGTLKIRAEDIEETGPIINVIRSNLSRCSTYIETDIINVPDVPPAPIEPTVEEPQLAVEEVVADDGNSDGKPEPESEPAADEPTA